MPLNPHDQGNEYVKHYTNTIIRVGMHDADIPDTAYVLSGSVQENASVLFHVRHRIYGVLRINLFEGEHKVLFDHPKRTLFNYARRMVFFARTPTRQWKRGLNNQTGELMVPTLHIGRGYNRSYAAALSLVDTELTHHIYYPEFMSLNEAADSLLAGRRFEVAVSPQFGLSLSHLSPKEGLDAFLWYEMKIVGTVSLKERLLFLEHDVVLQELLDYVHKTGQNEWQIIG
jgi:hypothetical protein